MTRVCTKLVLLVCCCGVFLAGPAAAAVSAYLDRDRIAVGETVMLTVVASGASKGTLDAAPLAAAGFDVLSQNQSTRMSIVNGVTSNSREWQLVLAPQSDGKLTVPALPVGTAATKPLSLDVLPAAQAARDGAAPPVMVEVEVDIGEPLVQQQVVYVVRILSRSPLRQASLSEPQAGDAIVERLGEDRSYQVSRQGRQYQVTERRYAVFPQRSGELAITAPVLSAQIPEAGRRSRSQGLRERFFGPDVFGDIDGFFDRGKPVRIRGEQLTLDVRPTPTTASTPWLPAKSLSLAETWSSDLDALHVGEPVTRTIALTAQGLTGSQLPDLSLAATDDVKVYPDKPQTNMRAEADTLIAQKVFKFALVANRVGPVALPAIDVHWWDTQSNSAQVATLPAVTIDVLPAAAGATTRPEQPVAPFVPETPATGSRQVGPSYGGDVAVVDAVSTDAVTAGADYWRWIAAALALGWLSTVLWWWRVRANAAPSDGGSSAQRTEAPGASLRGARRKLEQACRANDPRAARAALIGWSAARWPQSPPARLEALGRRLGGDARDVLQSLDQAIFSGTRPVDWDGDITWAKLAPLLSDRTDESRGSGVSGLPPLYPANL